jgi:hypothetical protein
MTVPGFRVCTEDHSLSGDPTVKVNKKISSGRLFLKLPISCGVRI